MRFTKPAGDNPIDRLKIVGRPTDRIDGPLKTTGTAPYAYEQHQAVPNAAYGYVQSAAGDRLLLRLGANELMRVWKGGAPITPRSAALFESPSQFLPVFLILDVTNDSTQPVQVASPTVRNRVTASNGTSSFSGWMNRFTSSSIPSRSTTWRLRA